MVEIIGPIQAKSLAKAPGRWRLKQDEQLRIEVESALAATPLFGRVSPDLLRMILGEATLLRVSSGQVLIEEGSRDIDIMYVLIEGKIEALAGGQFIVAMSDPGETVGEAALFNRQPRMAEVRAVTGASLVEIPLQAINAFRASDPERFIEFLELIAGHLAGKLVRTTRLVGSYGGQLLEQEQMRSTNVVLEQLMQNKLREVLLYSHIFRNSPDAILIAAPSGAVQSANPAAIALFGWANRELSTISVLDRLPELRDKLDLLQDPQGTGFKADWIIPDTVHGDMPVEVTLTPVVREGRVVALAIFLRDIRGQKLLLESLLQSKSELAGYSRDLAQKVEERTTELRMSVGDLLKANSQLIRETASKDAAMKKVQLAQSHLLQSEKMIGLGHLAAGVAHEINNPVGYVNSNLNTLKDYLAQMRELLMLYGEIEATAAQGAGALTGILERVGLLKKKMDYTFVMDDSAQVIADAQEGVTRVASIVRNLKDFTHLDQAQRQWVNINESLESTVQLIWNELKYKIAVTREYGEIPQIECYPQQLNQVFLNVLMNAVQAIREKGTITVKTALADDGIGIQISDDGCGIEPDVLPRIFEPFFTTRPVGKGMGLGLTSAYAIVSNHHGKIDVDSKPGSGAAFTIRLPIHQPKSATVLEKP